MKKNKYKFICSNCEALEVQWTGQCRECKAWNTYQEVSSNRRKQSSYHLQSKKIQEIDTHNYNRILTGINEFDRVLGDGIVNGTLVLIGGEPGIGKSSLLTMAMCQYAQKDIVLYNSGEESLHQIGTRFKRLKINEENLYINHESNWQKILDEINYLNPTFLIIDSIQTIYSSEIQSSAGSISQVREVTNALLKEVKTRGITCFIVGHITKDGAIAGPKVLEHMVDTVIYFEGDKLGNYRLLRPIKNRFGSTNEVGIFEMHDAGLREVKNPSQCFLDDQIDGAYGSTLSCILEGTRPIFIEIQSLVIDNRNGHSKKISQGFDNNRLNMICAVIEKYIGIPINMNDIYLNIIGGINIVTRDMDLGVFASLISSYKKKAYPQGTIFIGEIGLTGEVRSVKKMEERIKEAVFLNYDRIITSIYSSKKFKKKYYDQSKLNIIGIKSADELIDLMDII